MAISMPANKMKIAGIIKFNFNTVLKLTYEILQKVQNHLERVATER